MTTLTGAPAEFEQVVEFRRSSAGFDGVIAIHSTVLGPALGGVRLAQYPSLGDAKADAMRLGRAMTFKAAAAGLDLGGGKAVLRDEGATDNVADRVALFRAFGRAVESLGGRYITAEDVGTTVADMVSVSGQTRHVVGLPETHGGLGDPSPSTAAGVVEAMKAACGFMDGTSALAGKTVAVSGVGKVGWHLARLLVEEGAFVAVADIDGDRATQAADQLGAKRVDVEDITRFECDVFAPCAMGGVLTPAVIRDLPARAVVGAANNQLSDRACAELLAARGITYVPDFVANAGGLIHVALESTASAAQVSDQVRTLHDRVTELLERAAAHGISPLPAAEALAEQRLAARH